jgi:hypothetical protein
VRLSVKTLDCFWTNQGLCSIDGKSPIPIFEAYRTSFPPKEFFRTRGERKTLPSVLPTKEKRHNERNNGEEVKNDHIWRPAEERDKQSRKKITVHLSHPLYLGAQSANGIAPVHVPCLVASAIMQFLIKQNCEPEFRTNFFLYPQMSHIIIFRVHLVGNFSKFGSRFDPDRDIPHFVVMVIVTSGRDSYTDNTVEVNKRQMIDAKLAKIQVVWWTAVKKEGRSRILAY